MSAEPQGELRIAPLGGLGEIGMNCLALEQRGQVLLIDCGVTFDNRGLGVDVVHPDFACLEPYRDRIAGVFITHGHEDHIGALPYLLRRFDVPVWGPPYALGLVRERLVEHEVLAHARLIEVTPRTHYEVGSFTVEPIRVTHSIADATALAIATDAGLVIHSGDFKFDETPPDGEAFDVERLRQLADEKVALLLSDSTNIDSEGTTGSERGVGEALRRIVLGAKARVVVAMFASNVHRLRLLGEIARTTGRKIVPLGRSVRTHARVAHATGYLAWSDEDVFPPERSGELLPRAVLGVATGSQAEANAALARIARGEHPFVLDAGDMVIMSSRIIPGHEPEVFALMGDLIRRGVEVKTRVSDRDVHVSGHAHRGEQRRMLELVRPRAFVPVHGTLHHLTRHAALARDVGVGSACVLENGDVASLRGGVVTKVARWPAGRVHITAGKVVPEAALRERVALARDGIAFVIAAIDAAGRLVGGVQIATRGLVDEASSTPLFLDAKREASAAVAALDGERDDVLIAESVRLAVRRVFARELGYKPQVVAKVVRVQNGAVEAASPFVP
jgi:ribonuclease J